MANALTMAMTAVPAGRVRQCGRSHELRKSLFNPPGSGATTIYLAKQRELAGALEVKSMPWGVGQALFAEP